MTHRSHAGPNTSVRNGGGGRRYRRSTPMSGSPHGGSPPPPIPFGLFRRISSASSSGSLSKDEKSPLNPLGMVALLRPNYVVEIAKVCRQQDPDRAPLCGPALSRRESSTLADAVLVVVGGNNDPADLDGKFERREAGGAYRGPAWTAEQQHCAERRFDALAHD